MQPKAATKWIELSGIHYLVQSVEEPRLDGISKVNTLYLGRVAKDENGLFLASVYIAYSSAPFDLRRRFDLEAAKSDVESYLAETGRLPRPAESHESLVVSG
ncbi:hypothetical protein [Arsenicibacter rosenii]|uniref:Uncharacterized protein n=1 Tax=Arsenicibacter rosenii TaxID=1750698 RepID=A0A1S2VQZ6_9BACT|nr:hypothetical protein [Arsenicibacter rosenii]OIN61199.1 hypothetical protein BLX24_03825 [Arsenicibacter rosenii]